MSVIKINTRGGVGDLKPYIVMPMDLTVLNPSTWVLEPKSLTVHEFDGDRVSNVVMIIHPNFLLVDTRWYLRWRTHEFGFENWIKNPMDLYRNKKEIDFQQIDEIVIGIRRDNQINEILK